MRRDEEHQMAIKIYNCIVALIRPFTYTLYCKFL